MSAAIVKHWGMVNNEPPINFIGYNHGQPIPDLSEYDKVIMCDISFPKEEMLKLAQCKVANGLTWIDHHISAINDNNFTNTYKDLDKVVVEGVRDTKYAACELTWKYFFPNEAMPEIVRLLGRYDCFGHKGTDEELKVLELQYGARQCISNYEEAYDYLIESINHIPYEPRIEESIQNSGKAIYAYLCTEAKQIYKNGFEFHFYWAKDIGRLNNVPEQCHAKFICINKERFNPINFGIDYHKDGYDGVACFHYDGVAKLWRFSLYNDNDEVDCSIIAKQYGGGGHKGASGFVITDLNLIFK